jgi:membrane protease YdiL (CAAX protease family)
LNLADTLRLVIPAVLAIAAAYTLDRACAARGIFPPGFAIPWRRGAALALVALILWVGSLAPLSAIGRPAQQLDVSQITTPRLFLLHALLLAALGIWFLLGFAGLRPSARPEPVPSPGLEPDFTLLPDLTGTASDLEPAAAPGLSPDLALAEEEPPAPVAAPPPAPPSPPPSLWRQFLAQFGFLAPDVPREIGIGVLLGIGAWGAVLLGAFVLGGLVWALGGADSLPRKPPDLIPWIAALPIGFRLLVSLSAGVVEETFFRGFLQPRIGILLSTGLFVLAHFSYGQPFMLVGIGLLSLIYAWIVRWRQNIWPAIAAHTLFDGIQLLVVIPSALKLLEKEGGHIAFLLGIGN